MPAHSSKMTVLVLVAAAVVVSAPSAAPERTLPRIVAGAMLDADGDSRADRVRLTYSMRVRHPADRDGKYPFVVSGYRIRSVGAAGGKQLAILLVEKQAADPKAKPSIRYKHTRLKPVRDRSGNQAAAQLFRRIRAHGRLPAVAQPPVSPPPSPAPADRDGDGALDAQDCAPANPAIRPGAADAPDLAFVDSNCDGIDGDEKKAIFASPFGKNTNPGTKAAPMREINGAAAVAHIAGKDVYAAAGAYHPLGLGKDVRIYGGYGPETWARRAAPATVISGAEQGILASAATVELQLLTIQATSVPLPGKSVYGIRLVSGARMTLQRVTVIGGKGSSGAPGANGANGASGGAGKDGGLGDCDDDEAEGEGGSGGSSPDDYVGGRGGRGGGDGPNQGDPGSPGEIGTPAGLGGQGVDPGGQGSDGKSGADGAPGERGAGGTSSAATAATGWNGMHGLSGVRGAPGSGGGGGGGGAGQTGYLADDGAGSGGGGGGGGGGRGGGGSGGRYGGGSFGIYLENSTVIVSDGSSIRSDDGGPGGRGGHGGFSGAGGARGRGGVWCTDQVGAGGDGGFGGNGGRGGAGGGGAGGPSIGIFKAGTSTATVTGSTITTGAAGAGGAGGTGGVGPAGAGATGIAQRIYP